MQPPEERWAGWRRRAAVKRVGRHGSECGPGLAVWDASETREVFCEDSKDPKLWHDEIFPTWRRSFLTRRRSKEAAWVTVQEWWLQSSQVNPRCVAVGGDP